MQTIHYFAGGNTARGFYSCFDSVLPPAQRRRMYCLKGGPGVGKSTLMKRAAQAAEAKGHAVEYFHCSSDPDSLDGFSLPQLGIAMVDGTAPHVQDPVIPGARDTLLSLGDFLDEKALAPHAGEIGKVQEEISARFARCYRYLAAAREVLCAAPAAAENEQKAQQTAQEWAKLLPLRGGRGTVRKLFGAAFTPKGLVEVTNLTHMERRMAVDVPFGAHPDELMRTLSRLAAGRGLDVVELLDPLEPEHIAHVLVPAHGVAFCSAGDGADAETVFDLAGGSDRERGFDVNAYELLCRRAEEQLTAAKALHDELESFYVRNMDFEKWQTVLDRVIASLP